jgi:gliding motility-associated lipoprotein GldD
MRPSTKWLLALAVVAGCSEEPLPKPRGWFRIDLPAQAYAPWADSAVMAMEVPTYARVRERKAEGEARWYDLRFPGQRATVHLTWSPVTGNINELIEDAHAFKGKHEAKAVRIRSERILIDSSRVFGNVFDVEGDAASPLVFYLTDSTSNFLYGALYFDVRPNADSLAPVTERIRQDMRHMIGTLQWGSR